MSLSTDYRPSTFNGIHGNKLLLSKLQTILKRDKERIQHAFLFTGPRGCGKTTLARIVKNELGCIGDDYTEVDSGQFTGINTIREIRNNMMYMPLEGPCRVWCIDECHKLSNEAQNGLLKAIEEPPPHVYFILATTDPDKLIGTVKSRCAIFEVQPLDTDEMENFIKDICRKERKRLPQEVVKQIARDSLGGCRDALQILDTVIDLDQDEMLEAAKQTAIKENKIIELCRALLARNNWKIISTILEGLRKEEPESIRKAILKYAETVMLGEKKDPAAAYLMLISFEKPTYDAGFSRIVAASYECIS